jgi:segregation and condensation protein B
MRDADIPEHLRSAIEALLFAAEEPLTVEALQDLLQRVDGTPIAPGWVEALLAEIAGGLDAAGCGFGLQEVAGGWELRTRAAESAYVNEMYKRPAVRLSRAALEVLSVVAYRQPCTRADIEQIRGVDSSRTLRSLLERGLIRILGKADDVGRPMLYGTGDGFLTFFGLGSLTELPTLREYTELTEDHVVKLQELDDTLAANATERATEQGREGEVPDDD